MNGTTVAVGDFLGKHFVSVDRLEKAFGEACLRPFSPDEWLGFHLSLRALREESTRVGFLHLASYAQRGEALVIQLMAGRFQPQPPILGYLLNLVESMRQVLQNIQAKGLEEPAFGISPGAPVLPSPTMPGADPWAWSHQILLFRTPDDGRMAVPFDRVMRLEAFEPSTVTRESGLDWMGADRRVPLRDISQWLPERRIVFHRPPVKRVPGQRRQVILYAGEGGPVGWVVDEVLDVRRARIRVTKPASRVGVMGSTEMEGRLTELLDTEAAVSFRKDAQRLLA